MQETQLRCQACGNHVDEEDLFCGNCGREAPRPAGGDDARSSNDVEDGFVGFDCQSCGASLTYDSEAQGLRCSFCGSVSMKRQPAATGRLRAQSYVPFDVSRETAASEFERWISRGFFRPSGIRQEARLVSMQAVYVPFWVFRGTTHTFYAADSSRTPVMARADWCPVAGERSGDFSDVLVCASGSLRADEVVALSPYDFSRRRPYRRDELKAHAVEDFGLSRRGARPRARALILERERDVCADLVPGRSRNVHVNTLVRDLRSDPVLLPVWINAYSYRGEVYRFCVNGQTGKLVGRAPFSYVKLALVILAIAALAAIAAGVAFS